MTRDGVRTDARFEPNLVHFIAGCVDSHPSFKIVDAAQHQIHRTTSEASLSDSIHEMLEVVHGSDVVVVGLKLHVWVDVGQSAGRS